MTQYDKQRSESISRGICKGNSYQYITEHDSPNHWGQRSKTDAIVIHWWGDPATGPTFDGVVGWLCNPQSQASGHYVSEAGKVACIVDPAMMAWHVAQPGYVNQTTIGIECNPRAWDSDYETIAELVAEWGKLPVKRHKDYMPTQCPGVYDISRIIALAEQYYSGEETEKDDVELKPEVAAWITDLYDQVDKPEAPEWASKYWEEATDKGIVDGQRLNGLLTRCEYAASELRRVNK